MDKQLQKQQDFVNWLKNRDMYNPIASTPMMYFAFRVWEESDHAG